MTDTEINRAIAWALPDYYPAGHDFCYDLDAMHEAVTRSMESRLWSRYVDHLQRVTKADDHRGPHAVMLCTEATARQRAEAFLRTIGKWKET